MYGFVIGILLGVLIVVLGVIAGNPPTYKDGQIDALNGEIYYELQKQEDGTTDWIYVPEGVK